MDLSPERRREMYRQMLTIRAFDTEAQRLVEMGEVYGEVHQYIGEEAVAVGVMAALRQDDVITSTHRGHGHIIAKGGDVQGMMAELFGKVEGYCHGKGGSMHITSLELGIYGANGIVAAGAPIAVGAAYAARLDGRDSVAVTFFGDGGANQGVLHEAMNLAAIYHLPVIFVCENNGYAATFPVTLSTSVKDIGARGAAYGMPGVTIDGMDVFSVYDAARVAVERARGGGGPSLIEAKCFRYFGHFSGEDRLLKTRYRSADEIESWRERDPVTALGAHLVAEGIATPDELDRLREEVGLEVKAAVDYGRAGTDPPIEAAFADVYADTHPSLCARGW